MPYIFLGPPKKGASHKHREDGFSMHLPRNRPEGRQSQIKRLKVLDGNASNRSEHNASVCFSVYFFENPSGHCFPGKKNSQMARNLWWMIYRKFCASCALFWPGLEILPGCGKKLAAGMPTANCSRWVWCPSDWSWLEACVTCVDLTLMAPSRHTRDRNGAFNLSLVRFAWFGVLSQTGVKR